jgi:hypothetical protein
MPRIGSGVSWRTDHVFIGTLKKSELMRFKQWGWSRLEPDLSIGSPAAIMSVMETVTNSRGKRDCSIKSLLPREFIGIMEMFMDESK